MGPRSEDVDPKKGVRWEGDYGEYEHRVEDGGLDEMVSRVHQWWFDVIRR